MDEIDVKAAARILNVNQETVRRYYREGLLTGFKKGLSVKIWFKRQDVQNLLIGKSQKETV